MIALALALGLPAGCASVPVQSTDESNAVRIPEGVELVKHASVTQFAADPHRLEADVPRAIERCEWGKEKLQAPVYKLDAPITPKSEDYRLIRATARTADDQSVTILAWPVDAKTVAVQVRVGVFGDVPQEQKFVQALFEVMHGKAVKPRGGKFELPEID